MGKKKGNETAVARPMGGMAVAVGWPFYEALVSGNWQKRGELVSVLISRRSPVNGKVAAALLLVDLACLGIKSAQVKLFKQESEYRAGLRAHAFSIMPMTSVDVNLAAKIVLTGYEYAQSLGFNPDPVFNQAQHLLVGTNPDAVDTPVPTGGPDGKPLFINGPYDNVERIIGQLTRKLGEGNFHIMIGSGPPPVVDW